jgi:hypothetical protein
LCKTGVNKQSGHGNQILWPDCLSPVRPVTTNGTFAAETVIQKLVVSTSALGGCLLDIVKTDELIDRFRAPNGPKSIMEPKCHKAFVLWKIMPFEVCNY